jgi:nitronate monooxygenase
MTSQQGLPQIIQGGMGIGVSGYRLAGAVARAGGLGVVSGTAIDTVMVRRLQLGDADGATRRALERFPYRGIAERILQTYFVAGGKKSAAPFRLLPLPSASMSQRRSELVVAANYVEVALAKEGHDGVIGVNYLEKLRAPMLASLLGALIAGVDVVLIGAGIPAQIPDVLTKLSAWQPAELRSPVAGSAETLALRLDPRELGGPPISPVVRPAFIPIVSSHVIAKALMKRANGAVDGFVVEHHRAGGHNAPPRKARGSDGQSYGPLDEPELEEFRRLGPPFWLAGGVTSAESVRVALAAGAAGVQLGTPFAYCEESGIDDLIKRDVIDRARARQLSVVTDFQASPTGYPFKRVVRGDTGDAELQALRARKRTCDLGYLRELAVHQGALVHRCAGEPEDSYLHKGGAREDTVNKLCLCNQLLATVGLGQQRNTGEELPLLTAGEEIASIAGFIKPGATSYTASDVLEVLRGS